MRQQFNGKMELEWKSVDDCMPLDEFSTNKYGMVAHVLVLVVNTHDYNEDPAVVDIMYESHNNEELWKGWVWQVGEPYPEVHAKNIRYWTYHPCYLTKDILEYEKIKPLKDFCDRKKPIDKNVK